LPSANALAGRCISGKRTWNRTSDIAMSSPHDRAFLDDILTHPEDDTPRLIYADWLHDHGDPDRAEFIRLQIERASLDEDDLRQDDLARRERRLLACHTGWVNDLPRWARQGVTFRRGFPHGVWVTEHQFMKDPAALWKKAPIRALALSGLILDS